MSVLAGFFYALMKYSGVLRAYVVMAYAGLLHKTFSSGFGHRFLFVRMLKNYVKMENYFTEELKAKMQESLYKIRRVSSEFHQALETGYTVKDRDEFYRCFVRQLSIEITWIKNRLDALIEEGGEA